MAPIKILIINPNTNQSMTDTLRAPIESLAYNNTEYTYLTAPSGIASINNLDDTRLSAEHTWPSILPFLPTHHAFLVACYSPHPLVDRLKERTHKPVIGILAASVHTAVQLLKQGKGERFGIVSTGDFWKKALTRAVEEDVLGWGRAERLFAGVRTCGLDAGQLHGHGEVEERVKDAAAGFVHGTDKVGVVILGCAGMAGMEDWVREVVGEGVRVVDGVKAGVGVLQALVRGGF